MPTNLPPEAVRAEKRYKEASGLPEKIARLEEYLGAIPKHKGTDKLRASLRKRLSKLRDQSQGAKRAGARRESAFKIEREGAGQVAVVGAPNVGKSALVAALTSAEPEVAAYPWTTRAPMPGMMQFEDVQIQLVDTPPLTREHLETEIIDLIRRSDVILLVVDLEGDALGQLEEAAALLGERKIVPRHLEGDDAGGRGTVYLPLLVLVNKNDDESTDGDVEVFRELVAGDWPLLPVSAAAGRNLDELRRRTYDLLEVMRVYSRPPGRKADLGSPFTLKRGDTIAEFAAAVHGELREQLKSARVWGTGVHDGQTVGRDHVLHDGDVVELRV